MKRRIFIRKIALTVAGMSISGLVASKAGSGSVSLSDNLNVALTGCREVASGRK
ncbi:MAG: hypothetical protein ACUVTX_03410 [Bacteroidales bacterium]